MTLLVILAVIWLLGCLFYELEDWAIRRLPWFSEGEDFDPSGGCGE